MAYNTEHITNLAALKALAEKLNSVAAKQSDLEELSEKVEEIVTAGGEPNVIESVSVNGTALEVTEKAVNITVPTAVSALTNDADYQDADEVEAIFAEKLAEWIADAPEDLDTLKEIAAWIQGHAEDAAAMNQQISANASDISALEALIGELPEDADAETIVAYISEVASAAASAIDLSDYAKTAEVTSAISSALEAYDTSAAVDEKLESYIPTADIATDEEVEEMLDEVITA